MKMTVQQKQAFITDNLYHELRCLLGAATLWQIFKDDGAGFHVVVAMDSAFVHSRCLFKFFTEARGGNDISVVEFGAGPYPSGPYKAWARSLDRHVLHISKGRVSPTNIRNRDHLNEQVEAFARDIVRLWETFESDAGDYSAVLIAARNRAITDAANDAAGRISPLFS
jgi:Fe-S cluster biosynthesis and repair protein YggX